ncbi:TPA: YSIRK-type signal peptide-containing protein, partial [Streptococcus equi subsp. zooepidemicus]|nr:YSIRK-type signal peptide-containing protein [Streptococcus equi subsp. zooepidemicus]
MFLRNNTNKQYSLRRLKKGTASVAVALAVLGAGVATSQTVKADLQEEKYRTHLLQERYHNLRTLVEDLEQYVNRLSGIASASRSEQDEGNLFVQNNWVDQALGALDGQPYMKALEDQISKLAEAKARIEDLTKQINNADEQKKQLEEALQTEQNSGSALINSILQKEKTISEKETLINNQKKSILE